MVERRIAPSKKSGAQAYDIEGSNEIYTDNHIVKIWRLAHLLHHRIVQFESYAETAKTKRSLDVLKTKNEKVAKKLLTSPAT